MKIELLELPKTKHQLRDTLVLYRCIKKINEIVDAINGDHTNRKARTGKQDIKQPE